MVDPLKLDRPCFLINFFFYIRMIKYRAQRVAREGIKTTIELGGPAFKGPAESELGSVLVMCVRAHNPGSTPEEVRVVSIVIFLVL